MGWMRLGGMPEMVKYLKLVLDGFGCFAGKAEFDFSGGIDTLSMPNEAGKSMMLNGLIHTIFGMDKKAKDRFRPWGGAALSRGELTMESDGTTHIIRMDFAGDRVEVLTKDALTGALTAQIPNHVHVPGGKRSQKYMEFLSGVFGTAEEDAFRAAYVIEQPISGEFALGAGKDLLTGQGSELLERSIKELVDRLGKAPDGITRFLDSYDEESSKQVKDRKLEQLKEKMSDVRGRLEKAVVKLDEIQPSKEELASAKESLASAQATLKKLEQRRDHVLNWADLREEYRTKQKEAAEASNYMEAVKREDDILKSLKLKYAEGSKKELKIAYEEHMIASLEKTASDVQELLRASDGMACTGDAAGLLSGPGLLSPDAEGLLQEEEDDARRKAGELRRLMDAASEWERRFSKVSGMDKDDRQRLDLLIKKASAQANKGLTGPKAAAGIIAIIGIAAIASGAFLHLTWLAVAGTLVLGLAALIGFRAAKGDTRRRTESMADEGEIAEAKRTADLYDSMAATERPVLPDDAEQKLAALVRRAATADTLLKTALKAKSRLDVVTADALEALADLSESAAPLTREGILDREDAFWGAVHRRNTSRALDAEALRKAGADVAAAENAVVKMLSAKGFESFEKLREYSAQRMVDAASAYSAWKARFSEDLIFKPTLEDEILKKADEELDKLEEEKKRALQESAGLESRVRGLEDELRQADSESLSNIPELEDEIELLQEEELGLLSEAEALGHAIRALRRAGASFSTGARGALEQKATSLLQEITRVDRRRVGVRDDFSFDVSLDGSGIAPQQLSQGTRDQLYISMRLAAASVLEDGRKVPIFMDDSFGTTDSARLARIKSMLDSYASERQFIVLSHSEDISGWGNPITRG